MIKGLKQHVHPLTLKENVEFSKSTESILQREDIKLLTQNMFCLPGIPEGKKKSYKDERVRELVGRVLPEYDIMCFQEVFYSLNSRKENLV